MVASRRVRIVAEDIGDVSTRVPRRSDGIPEPDQVAQSPVSGVAVEHDVVELLAGFGTPGSPPEPASVSFVQGSPDDGDSGPLEMEELVGYCVKIIDYEGVILFNILA
jgi:hypothetical protein